MQLLHLKDVESIDRQNELKRKDEIDKLKEKLQKQQQQIDELQQKIADMNDEKQAQMHLQHFQRQLVENQLTEIKQKYDNLFAAHAEQNNIIQDWKAKYTRLENYFAQFNINNSNNSQHECRIMVPNNYESNPDSFNTIINSTSFHTMFMAELSLYKNEYDEISKLNNQTILGMEQIIDEVANNQFTYRFIIDENNKNTTMYHIDNAPNKRESITYYQNNSQSNNHSDNNEEIEFQEKQKYFEEKNRQKTEKDNYAKVDKKIARQIQIMQEMIKDVILTNDSCPSIIRMAKCLIQYKVWIHTMHTSGKKTYKTTNVNVDSKKQTTFLTNPGNDNIQNHYNNQIKGNTFMFFKMVVHTTATYLYLYLLNQYYHLMFGHESPFQFKQFAAYLNQPKINEPQQFASVSGGTGITLTLKPRSNNKFPRYLSVSWLSISAHKELLFYGKNVCFKIVNITETGKKNELAAFNKFQSTLQNEDVKWNKNEIANLVKLIRYEIQSRNNEHETEENALFTDTYITDYAYGRELFHDCCFKMTHISIKNFRK
eukprot:537816_1